MSALEKRELPQFVANPGPYVETRNHILSLWRKDVNNFLQGKQVARGIQVNIYSLFQDTKFAGQIQMLYSTDVSVPSSLRFHQYGFGKFYEIRCRR